jgi:hypothetical protein
MSEILANKHADYINKYYNSSKINYGDKSYLDKSIEECNPEIKNYLGKYKIIFNNFLNKKRNYKKYSHVRMIY